MNSLDSTIQYELGIKKLFNLEELLSKDLSDYKVNKELYSFYLPIFKNMKHIYAKALTVLLEKDIIEPYIFADPISSNKKILLPYALNSFLKIDKKTKKIISCLDLSLKSRFLRDSSSSKAPTALTLNEMEFYTLSNIATIKYFAKIKEQQILYSKKFREVFAGSYAILAARCFNTKFGIANDMESVDVLRYHLVMFVLNSMMGLSPEKAFESAKTMRTTFKIANVEEYSKTLVLGELDHSNFNKVIELLEKDFNHIRKGSLQFRNFVYAWSNMFGPNASLAIEHGDSFLIMVIISKLKMKFYNDRFIIKSLERYSGDLERIFADFIYFK